MNTFKAFLMAYADGARNAALYLWDEYHSEWSSGNKKIASAIINQIDSPGTLMTAEACKIWYNNWIMKTEPIAKKYLQQSMFL